MAAAAEAFTAAVVAAAGVDEVVDEAQIEQCGEMQPTGF